MTPRKSDSPDSGTSARQKATDKLKPKTEEGSRQARATEVTARTESTMPKASRRNILVSSLVVLLVVVLAVVGVLVWRSMDLSGQVNELSTEVLELSTELTATTTTSTTDPWNGNASAYGVAWSNFTRERSMLILKDAGVPSNLAKTHARAVVGDIEDLASTVNWFPDAPQEVQQAQDDYFDALMELAAAGSVVMMNDSWSNVDAWNAAWTKERQYLGIWRREFGRAYDGFIVYYGLPPQEE